MKKPDKLVPELRFPEFVSHGEWIVKPLIEVYSFKNSNSFSRDKLNYNKGIVKNIHYGDIHTKFSTLFDITKEIVPFITSDVSIETVDKDNFCIEGDIIFADASEDLDDVGKSIEIVNLNNEKVVAGLHTFLARQTEPKFVIGFGGHLFKSNSIRIQIKRESQGAKVFGISKGRISGINIYYPASKEEQQNIALCLSSLDELIAAHNEKLAALKVHKKGLMQNLFPQEGEKLPKYRFPEFENEGECETKTIGIIAKVTTGNKDTQNKIDNGIYPFFVRSQTVERINSYSFDGEAILTSGDGVGVGKNFHYINGKFDYHQRVYCIYDFVENVSGEFVFMYFSQYFNERVMRMSAKNSVDSVRMAMITEMPISLPGEKEQLRIADCFSSLNKLITSQLEKIKQLQLHKKGLMQGLFPKVND